MNEYTYNGVTCQATERRSSDRADKKYMRTVIYDGSERVVHYGDPDMPMRRNNPDARADFLARHQCDTKRDPFAPGFWACLDWARPEEGRDEEVYTNLPKSQWAKMDRCVSDVMETGKDKAAAIAICYTSIAESGESWREAQPADLKPHGPDFDGSTWEVTLIGARSPSDVLTIDGEEYVWSLNRRAYSCAGLAESVPQWEGCQVYDNHLTDAEFDEREGMRSVARELIGVIVSPWWDADARKLKGVLKIGDKAVAEKLKGFWDLGVIDKIGGLSIDTIPDHNRDAVVNGESVKISRGFQRIFSADLVARPGAGGGIDRLIESSQNLAEEQTMEDEMMKALLIEAAKAGAAAAIAEMQAAATPPPADGEEDAVGDVEKPTPPQPVTEEGELKKRLDMMECQIQLRDALDAAGLDKPHRGIVEAALQGRTFKKSELDALIKRAREAQSAGDASGRVQGAGGTQRGLPIGSVMDSRDKAQMELIRLIAGSDKMRKIENNERDYVRERYPEGWDSWIKASRPNYGTRRLSDLVYNLLGGNPMTDSRAYEASSTSGLASITKNALNLILAADYSTKLEWWERIVTTEELETIDQATLVRTFGLSNLSVVDEGAAYLPLALDDGEETADFVKNGNYVGVTLEAMMKDKLNVLRNIPQKLSNSWYNTLSARVAAVFTVNSNTGPVLSDTGALFNATATGTGGGHANLLTSALSFASYGAARTAMMKQTDMALGAGRKLMIQPRYLLVPADLETTALQIRNSEKLPGSANNDVNPHFERFDVIPVPEWTDVSDWALVADPAQFPAIWMLFLRGNRVPTLVSAGAEDSGAMFTNDELRWKVRQMSFRFSATYDCAPVSDFRPLHKSNV